MENAENDKIIKNVEEKAKEFIVSHQYLAGNDFAFEIYCDFIKANNLTLQDPEKIISFAILNALLSDKMIEISLVVGHIEIMEYYLAMAYAMLDMQFVNCSFLFPKNNRHYRSLKKLEEKIVELDNGVSHWYRYALEQVIDTMIKDDRLSTCQKNEFYRDFR